MDTTCNIQQCWELLANNVASVCTDGKRIVLKAIGLNSRQQKLSTCIAPFFYISLLLLHVFSRILQKVNTWQRFSFFFKLTYSPLKFSSRKIHHWTFDILDNMEHGRTHITSDKCFPKRRTHITRDMCFSGGGTHITKDMCFPAVGTHITKDMCFPGGEHMSLGICVFPGGGTHVTRNISFPGGGTHITSDMFFPGGGTHITTDICFPGGGTHVTRDMCFQGRETHITRDMCFLGRGTHNYHKGYVFPRWGNTYH